MTTDGFSKELREVAAHIWEKIFAHPFLAEIERATLPLDKFKFYIKQDYTYLVDFARCLGIAAAKSEDIETMRTLASLLEAGTTIEIEMLEGLGERLGVPAMDLRTAEPAPSNVAYMRHFLYVAYSGSVGEIMASMLPCMWTYQEIGERIEGGPAFDEHPFYREWRDTYRSREYVELVGWYKDLTDRYASEAGSREKGLMKKHFLLSSRYEFMFWDMAYKKETWPV